MSKLGSVVNVPKNFKCLVPSVGLVGFAFLLMIGLGILSISWNPRQASAVANGLRLIPAQSTLACGERTTVLAELNDEAGRPAPDGTLINFIALNGTLTTSQGNVGTNRLAAGTQNGALTLFFMPDPSLNGSATVSASAGPFFEWISILVDCPLPADRLPTIVQVSPSPASVSRRAASSQATGAVSSAQPAPEATCINIGDNICIKPPSTGNGGIR